MNAETLPLFPLRTVLFPVGRLQLQIFEPRYLGMVRDCLQNDANFGVVLIRDGEEVMLPQQPRLPQLMPMGTFAHIVDWNPLSNNRLGVLVQGQGRFRVLKTSLEENYLVTAKVRRLPEESEPGGERAQVSRLAATLRALMLHPAVADLALCPDFEDAWQVSCLLAQLLPIPEKEKYQLLTLNDTSERLEKTERHIRRMGGIS